MYSEGAQAWERARNDTTELKDARPYDALAKTNTCHWDTFVEVRTQNLLVALKSG
jgi:hypothetical protein